MLKSVVSSKVVSQVRSVSSKYPRPTPRHYKRRLFEAAVAPEVPRLTQVCFPPGLVNKENIEASKSYSDVEIALSKLVKQWMVAEEFRVLAVCQFLPVPGRTLWLAKNQLRTKGIEFRTYGNKILKQVFTKTPISALDVTFIGTNAILLAKDHSAIKTIVQETDKLNWIVPLVMMVDDRIVSMDEAKKLAELHSLEDLRAHTVQILTQQTAQITQTLENATRALPSALDFLASDQRAK
ncbi:unnamed protein product [Caenorhabditis auriculariae]|uniref:Large ribosomal subunit protein uL10m n=1 Tax=Caenorhabditis auriculariae TaxID=2777116 RepID=A0A8S1HP01_9PELO|nr:unnamed protein product [Caenorhabditis auriculariae]